MKALYLGGLSADEASEIFNLRALLKRDMLKGSGPQMNDSTKKLAIFQWNDFSKSTDPSARGGLNWISHRTLYADSGPILTKEVADNTMCRVDRYIRSQLVVIDGIDKAKQEHVAILDACLSSNAELAVGRLGDHI